MSLNINAIANEYQAHKDKEEGNKDFLKNFVKLPDGKGTLRMRFLPPAKDGMFDRQNNPFYQWTRTHKVNGKNLHCPRVRQDNKWVGECPICSYIRWLWDESKKKAPDEAERMQNEYRSLKATERYYYNVIVRETVDGEKNAGPLIYSCGIQVHGKVLAYILGDDDLGIPKLDDISDIKSGYDFKLVKTIRKSGTKEFANYETSSFEHQSSPLGEPEGIETWLNNLYDLVTLRTVKTPEELKHELKIHLGVVKDNQTGFDPTEFQSPEEKSSVTVETEPVAMAQESVDEEPPLDVDPADDGDGGAVVADKEFLDQLRNIG